MPIDDIDWDGIEKRNKNHDTWWVEHAGPGDKFDVGIFGSVESPDARLFDIAKMFARDWMELKSLVIRSVVDSGMLLTAVDDADWHLEWIKVLVPSEDHDRIEVVFESPTWFHAKESPLPCLRWTVRLGLGQDGKPSVSSMEAG